jgi:hypothetical protein
LIREQFNLGKRKHSKSISEKTNLHIVYGNDRVCFHRMIKRIVSHSHIDQNKYTKEGAYFFYCAYFFHLLVKVESNPDKIYKLTWEELEWGAAATSQTDIYHTIITDDDDWTWHAVRYLGLPLLLSQVYVLKETTQLIAKAEWKKTKDPNKCALFYIAANKISLLAKIYKEHEIKVTHFLERYEESPDDAVVLNAARANAYKLISSHRYDLAAAFFLLSGDIMAAVNTIITRMKDWLLAILVARVSDDSDPTLFHKILNDTILPEHKEDESLITLLNTIRQPKPKLQRKNLLKTLYEDTDS